MAPQQQSTPPEQTERILRQALSRLSLAIETSDQRLAERLKALRSALKTGASGERIQELMEDISAIIIHLDQHKIAHNVVATILQHVIVSLKSTPLPEALRESTDTFKHRLTEASQRVDLSQALNAHADYLLAILAWITASADTMFDPQQAVPPFNQVLFDLLHRLDLPKELDDQRQRIAQLLHQPSTVHLAGQAVNDIADLMAKSRLKIEREKSEIEGFLAQLTTHLVELERYLEVSLDSQGHATVKGRAIHASVSAEVAEIRRSVDEAQDIQVLKARIQVHLENIQENMLAREKLEATQLAQVQAELEQLRDRLARVECESNELRARLREAHEQALRDALTGLHNRLAYDQRIVQECEHWHRYAHPTVLCIWDIDYFKRINDTFSHTAGDNALKALAKLMQESTRKSDFLARFGGEEFMLLLPETTIDTGLHLANRLRERIAAKRFQYRGQLVPLSVSCGLAEFIPGDTPEDVYRRADAALYQAKAAGRNCCVVFSS